MTRDEQWVLDEKYPSTTLGASAPGFKEDCARLAGGEPVAYVIGSQPFLGLTIHLDSRPLIPRPETEWWTEQLLREPIGQKMGVGLGLAARSAPIFGASGERKLKFLDLCAGSGAIGCAALKMLPTAQVFFGEIDAKHESTILKNIRENNLDAARAHVKIGDLFAPFSDTKFDIIAANPPYIPESRELPESVARYEPSLALRAREGGLGIIRRIAQSLPNHLHVGGVAWIECDSEHAEEARALFATQGFVASIRTDQYGASRVIVVSFRQ